MAVKTLTIDGQLISSREENTLLFAAREAGVTIPTLCYVDGLSPVGACRLCLVEVAGSNRLQAACTTTVQEGMEIRTNTPKLQEYRRMILELLFAERNHVCSVCVANNHCELQDLAMSHGMDHVRFDYLHPKCDVDTSHERFGIDHNRCILCTRCVRACDEIEGRTYLGCLRTGYDRSRCDRYAPTVGRSAVVHVVRQVCASLPNRRDLSPGIHSRRDGTRSRNAPIPCYGTGAKAMDRLRLATVWLAGCSGCHMSFLDLDEWLLELAAMADLVYSPVLDTKQFPDDVDVTLVEGAVANHENLEMLRTVRKRSKVLVSFGDCAVTGNVTALRNPLHSAQPVLDRSYVELADANAGLPSEPGILPVLLDRVEPLHAIVPVDFYLPGCPPSAPEIRLVLESLIAGQVPCAARQATEIRLSKETTTV